MHYNELCPVWIIDTTNDDGGFIEKLSRQLLAFSKNEFGNAFNEESHRWWKIERLSKVDDIAIDVEGHPSGIPAYKLEDGNFDIASLTVVVIGLNQTFGLAIDIVNELRKRKDAASFMAGVASRVRYYGVLPFKKVDFQQKDFLDPRVRKLLSKDPRPFDSVFLQGDCNRVDRNGENYSYAKLIDEDGKRHDVDLLVQIVYHLALTQGTLSRVNNNSLNVVGAFSLNYEPSKERERVARGMTKSIAAKFLNDNLGEYWHKESTSMLSESFETDLGWKFIYGKFKGGFESLSTEELCPQPQVSPWTLCYKYLIPKYFKRYIKGIVRQLRSNVDGYSFLTSELYQNHLDNQYESIISESEQKKRIEDELSSIWDKDNKNNYAIGMMQFSSRLKKMREFFVSQKNTVERLKNVKTADGKNNTFPMITDYPLGNFGVYKNAYMKFANSMGPEENKKEEKNDLKGDGILNKIIRILAFHPVPLSLLSRSVLVGILLPLVLLTLLRFIPDIVINTSWFETKPGNVVLVASCFLICVLCAILKYFFGVVKSVEAKIKEYVGWRLYRMQMSAYDLTLEFESDYYTNAIRICDEIAARVEDLLGDADISLVSESPEYFEENKFQANALGVYEGNNILNDNQLHTSVTVSINEFGRDVIDREIVDRTGLTVTDKIYYGVLRNALVTNTTNGLLDNLKSLLFASIDKGNANAFWDDLIKYIKEDVVFDIAGHPINSLYDMVFCQDDNLNKWLVGKQRYSICDVIRERSYPSADVLDAAFYFASIVLPVRRSEDSHSWRKILDMEDETGMFDTRKGVYELSILQGLSIASISMVSDFNLQ